MSDMEDIEELTFLPANETSMPINKRNKYEPRLLHRCCNIACSKTFLQTGLFVTTVVAISVTVALFQQMHHKDSTTTDHRNAQTNTTHKLLATNGEAFPWSSIRLPTSIKPLTYHIQMHPDLKTFKFSGSVKIKFEVLEATDFIVFHVKGLKITQPEVTEDSVKIAQPVVTEDSTQTLHIDKYLENKEHQQAYVQLHSRLRLHKRYTLALTFQGDLPNSMTGFYRSAYTTKDGKKRWLATTQFEPTDARAAFPCFDEPHMKANFIMKMTHSTEYRSLFNTKLVSSSSRGQQLMEDTFEETVRMSTYLVAFIVCDFAEKSTNISSGTKVSVYTPPDNIQQATFALQVAKVVLEYYETFFGVTYPLKKLDLVAIPDFSAGAMENWGLVTYRLTTLLYESGVSSTWDKQRVAVVVAHELAHQWFGNLVTMKWWNDLWLNEGFASFVEYLGTNKMEPDWKMMELFISETWVKALYKDSLMSSHPISVPVHNPAQINEIFDNISYKKGASIIRMLKSMLRLGALEKGLKRYLKKFAYSNAVTVDLWNSLSEKAGFDIKKVMATWTAQMGYPLVTLTITGHKVTASQKRFLLDESDNRTSAFTSPYNYKWYIPLTYQTDKTGKKLVWMNMTGVSFDISDGVKWIKANVNMTGFYRVQYSQSNWQTLINQLKADHTVFSAMDRANLLDDVFALAMSGQLDLNLAMEMSTYLQKETEYLPWVIALRGLSNVEDLFELKPAHKLYAAYILKLLDQQLRNIKWEGTGSHLEKYMRVMILRQAVRHNHEPSVKKAKELFNNWMNNNISLAADLKSIVYQAGVQHGGETEWNFIWQRYENATVPSEKVKLLYALAYTTDAIRLQRLLEKSLDETQVRRGETTKVLMTVADKPVGRILAWHFLRKHWDVFYKRYGTGSFSMSYLIVATTGGFTSDFSYKEVEMFFESHDPGSGKRAVAEALENIRMKTNWQIHHTQAMTEWLKQHTA